MAEADKKYQIEKDFEQEPVLSGPRYGTGYPVANFLDDIQRILFAINSPADAKVVLKDKSKPENIDVNGEYNPETKDISIYGVGKARNLTEDLYQTVGHEAFHALAYDQEAQKRTLQFKDDMKAKGYSDKQIQDNLKKMIDVATTVGLPSMGAWANGHEMMATLYGNKAVKESRLPTLESGDKRIQAVVDSSPMFKQWFESPLGNFPYNPRVKEWSALQQPGMAVKQVLRSLFSKDK